jgi:arylsulfatase
MEDKPNIIIFCTDHQRADFLGCAGHPLIKTPNLDRLATRGVRFENMYIQNTVCMPSRASIMTGTYPCRHGVTSNGYNLTGSQPTIADALSQAGYHTMAVGRTHLICTQPQPEYSRTDFFGFHQCAHAQVYCGDTDPENDYLKWISEKHPEYYDDIAFANRHRSVDMYGTTTAVPQELSMNTWVVNKSLEFISEHKEKSPEQPFFLWAGTWDPHSPYRAPEPWGSMYNPNDIPAPKQMEEEIKSYPGDIKRMALREFYHNPDLPMEQVWKKTIAMYMGMVSHIDDQLGRMLDELEKLGITDNTVILFTSDHGDMLGDHYFLGKVLYFYDAVLKVPAIMAGPGIPQGKCVSQLTETVDYMPTLLELSRTPVPRTVQGKSLLPLLKETNETLHGNTYTEHQYFSGKNDKKKNEHIFSIFDGRYRIVYFKGRPYGQLFDLEKDPDSHHNLWGDPEYSEIKNDMKLKLLERMAENLTKYEERQAAW